MKIKFRSLFTLIEIMIAVAIIGLLLAVAVPSLTGNRNAAFDKDMENKIKIVEIAKQEWKLDNPGSDGTVLTIDDIKKYMAFVDSLDDLKVNGKSISLGGVNTKASY